MVKRKVNTRYGEVTYSIMSDIYPGLAFIVESPNQVGQIEFNVSEKSLSIEDQEQRVCLFMAGYEAGRQRGRWEKSKKLKELFSGLHAEMLGV